MDVYRLFVSVVTIDKYLYRFYHDGLKGAFKQYFERQHAVQLSIYPDKTARKIILTAIIDNIHQLLMGSKQNIVQEI